MTSCDGIDVEPFYTGERLCRRQESSFYRNCLNGAAAQFQQCLYP